MLKYLFFLLLFICFLLLYNIGCNNLKPLSYNLLKLQGTNVVWWTRSLPLQIVYDDNLPVRYYEAVQKVASEINTITGRKIFNLKFLSLRDTVDHVHVFVENIFPDCSVSKLGLTRLMHQRKTGKILLSRLKLRGCLDGNILLATVRHEMLHVLGFGHDMMFDSIMTPYLTLQNFNYTTLDKERLKYVYGIGKKVNVYNLIQTKEDKNEKQINK